ncbi:hypothetical protein SynBMKMC1_01363 [Synechococcus sp. BMK-MC-1]|nr:hypothetical protein SynBMKMC1_01363 [Synechococcus sp. BMK-MC-1]
MEDKGARSTHQVESRFTPLPLPGINCVGASLDSCTPSSFIADGLQPDALITCGACLLLAGASFCLCRGFMSAARFY